MAILTSGNITKSKLFEQSHANLFNTLKNNLTHPYRSGEKLVFVRPDLKERYPQIIVPPINLNLESDSMDGTRGIVTWELPITILTKDNTSDPSGDPNAVEKLNQLSDDILEVLNANSDTLRNYGMSNFMVLNSNFDWDTNEGLYSREILVRFRHRLVIA